MLYSMVKQHVNKRLLLQQKVMLLDTLLTMFLTIDQCTQQGVLSLSNGIKSIDFKTTEKYIFEEALKV